MPRGFGWWGIAVAMAAVLLLTWRLVHAPVRDPVIGQRLPVELTQPLPGRAYPVRAAVPRLVNLFASWCLPCRAEAPVLAGLALQGVAIDGIAVRDELPAVHEFLARYGDPFARVQVDPKGRLQADLAVSGLPETYIVDARGVIVYRHRGNLQPGDAAELQRRLAAAR